MMRFFAALILLIATSSALWAQVVDCIIDDGISVYREATGRWKTESYGNPISPEVLRYRLEVKPLGLETQGYNVKLISYMGQFSHEGWMCNANSLSEIYLEITCIDNNGAMVRINPNHKKIITWFESLHYLYGVTGNYDGTIDWVDGDYDLNAQIRIGTCMELYE